MELRPALRPPPLDPALVTRLALIADQLDGAAPGREGADLAAFNRLAGTSLSLTDFQGIYGAMSATEFVRRLLYRRALAPDPALTHAEMTEVVSRVMACAPGYDFYLELFLVNCKHPSGTGLIYWPDEVPELPPGREPTAAEVAGLALRGRAG